MDYFNVCHYALNYNKLYKYKHSYILIEYEIYIDPYDYYTIYGCMRFGKNNNREERVRFYLKHLRFIEK